MERMLKKWLNSPQSPSRLVAVNKLGERAGIPTLKQISDVLPA